MLLHVLRKQGGHAGPILNIRSMLNRNALQKKPKTPRVLYSTDQATAHTRKCFDPCVSKDWKSDSGTQKGPGTEGHVSRLCYVLVPFLQCSKTLQGLRLSFLPPLQVFASRPLL